MRRSTDEVLNTHESWKAAVIERGWVNARVDVCFGVGDGRGNDWPAPLIFSASSPEPCC